MPTIFEPYDKLVPIVILGKPFEVPENNVLLRQLQYVSEEIGSGRYCWNGECRCCEVGYRLEGGKVGSALGCQLTGLPGLEVTTCTPEMRYDLGPALAAAERPPGPAGQGGTTLGAPARPADR